MTKTLRVALALVGLTVGAGFASGQEVIQYFLSFGYWGIVGAAVAGPVAAGLAQLGPAWALRFAFALFAMGTILAILLPRQVDSARGERQVGVTEMAGAGARRGRWGVPPAVVTGLRANFGLRMLSGFLTIFLAFLLRNNPPAGWEDRFTLLLGLALAAALPELPYACGLNTAGLLADDLVTTPLTAVDGVIAVTDLAVAPDALERTRASAGGSCTASSSAIRRRERSRRGTTARRSSAPPRCPSRSARMSPTSTRSSAAW